MGNHSRFVAALIVSLGITRLASAKDGEPG
jgi:hypothetical protein